MLGGTTAAVGRPVPAARPDDASTQRDLGAAQRLAARRSDELEPFYRRAEALLQIEGEVYDERVWDGFGVERPRVDPARVGAHRFTVWCPEPHLGRLYRPRLAASANVRVLLQCHRDRDPHRPPADRFDAVCAARRRAGGVRMRRAGRACCAPAAIENARLLLASDAMHTGGWGTATT